MATLCQRLVGKRGIIDFKVTVQSKVALSL